MLFKLILLFCVAARIAGEFRIYDKQYNKMNFHNSFLASNFEVNENTNAADLWEQYKVGVISSR